VQTVVENVVKGFFLTISNPNATAYTFSLGFHCNPTPGTPAERTLASAVGFIDDGTAGKVLNIVAGATGNDFSASVQVAARGTVLVGILPAFFTNAGLAAPTIESRGWVDITLPALVARFGFSQPQATMPVSVLLVPEQRLTFLPVAGDVASAVEGQAAFTLPLATGMAEVQVPPQPGGFIVIGPLEAGM